MEENRMYFKGLLGRGAHGLLEFSRKAEAWLGGTEDFMLIRWDALCEACVWQIAALTKHTMKSSEWNLGCIGK